MFKPMQTSGLVRIATVVALAIVVAGCSPDTPTPAFRPSPTPGPPTIRDSALKWQFEGSRLTLQVIVDPKDSATDVVFEYGSGSTFEETPVFDQTLVMAEGMIDPGQVSATTGALPADWWFCGQVTATNAFGSVSRDVGCDPRLIRPTDTSKPSAPPSG